MSSPTDSHVMRTWKDGINERLVCVVCRCDLARWDHSPCQAIATNRGHFGSLAVRESVVTKEKGQ